MIEHCASPSFSVTFKTQSARLEIVLFYTETALPDTECTKDTFTRQTKVSNLVLPNSSYRKAAFTRQT